MERPQTSLGRGVGVLFLASALLGSTFARGDGTGDVLKTPALHSDRAAHNLLLEVDRAGNRLVAVGMNGHVIQSEDNGANWEQADVPVAVLLTAVDFPVPEVGFAVGHGGAILKSTDGGKSWKLLFDGNNANTFVVEAAQSAVTELEAKLDELDEEKDAATFEEVSFALDDARFALEDAETDAEVGSAKPFLDVWFKDAQVGYAVGAYGFFFRTNDGGESWQNWAPRLDNPSRFHLNAIDQGDDQTLFVAGEAGMIFRSTDDGETWETLDGPYEGSLFGMIGTGQPQEVLAYGLRGNLFLSTDNGDSWAPVEAPGEETLMGGARAEDGTLVLVGNNGMLLLSRDAGRTFSAFPREDRSSLVSALFLGSDRLLLAGQNGVSILKGVAGLK